MIGRRRHHYGGPGVFLAGVVIALMLVMLGAHVLAGSFGDLLDQLTAAGSPQ